MYFLFIRDRHNDSSATLQSVAHASWRRSGLTSLKRLLHLLPVCRVAISHGKSMMKISPNHAVKVCEGVTRRDTEDYIPFHTVPKRAGRLSPRHCIIALGCFDEYLSAR